MNVLVTGGAGFIGSHVVELLLEQGHSVGVVDSLSTGKKEFVSPSVKLFPVDICSPAVEAAFPGVEAVIHLAAQASVSKSLTDPDKDAETNILGTVRVLKCCQKYNVRKIIYATTAAEIGEPEIIPIDEKHPVRPLSPYGLSKAGGEEYVRWYGRQYQIPFTILRYANVYGPRQDHSGEGGVVAIFVSRCLSGAPLTIFGAGTQTRDFVFVKDVAQATVRMLTQGEGKKYNVGSGKETSILELSGMIQELLRKVPVQHLPVRAGDIQRSVFSIHAITHETGWKPEKNLRDGIQETIAYHEKIGKTKY